MKHHLNKYDLGSSKWGEAQYLYSGGGGFTFSVLYEISHFLHGRNIPFAIFAVKRLKKITVRLKSYAVKRCEINENWRETGRVRAEGGGLYTRSSATCCVGVCKKRLETRAFDLFRYFFTPISLMKSKTEYG